MKRKEDFSLLRATLWWVRKLGMAYSKTRDSTKHWSNQGQYNSSGSAINQSQSTTNVRTGQRNVGWRQAIKAGSQAGSPFSATYWNYEIDYATFAVRGYHTSSSSTRMDKSGSFVIGNQTVSDLALPDNPSVRALTRAHEKLRAQRSHWNALLFAGELRESVAMVRNPAQGLVRFFTEYAGTAKRLRNNLLNRKYSRKRIQQALAELWLEASFGWRPLISDVKDGAEAVARVVHGNADRRERVVASAYAEACVVDPWFTPSLGSTVPYCNFSPSPRFAAVRTKKTVSKVRYVIGLRHSLVGPSTDLSSATDILGVTLENFVPTIYNLLPYSFLLDYFSNVGDIIEANFTDQSNVAWISITSITESSVELTLTFDEKLTRSAWTGASYVCQSATGSTGRYLVTRKVMSRTTPTSLSVPPLTLTSPETFGKWANMVALFKARSVGAYRNG